MTSWTGQHHGRNRNDRNIIANEAPARSCSFFVWGVFMKSRPLLLAILFAFVSSNLFAHGNKVHVLGTLEKINLDSVLVKTKEGKSVEVKLVASTVYVLHVTGNSAKASDLNEDKPAKVSDLAVGDAVVIHATPKDNTLEADEIRFSVPAATKTATSAPAKPKS
jgi:hypothetical protein